jgi:dihydroorotate dehydrogenase
VNIYQFFRPLIFKIEPEKAHNLALNYLKFLPKFSSLLSLPKDYENLNNSLWNLNFLNPVGMSAGFDKNAEIIMPLFNFGFGFVEAGTTTPIAQTGNEQPRIFRLIEDQALINRLGFNNLGADYIPRID